MLAHVQMWRVSTQACLLLRESRVCLTVCAILGRRIFFPSAGKITSLSVSSWEEGEF